MSTLATALRDLRRRLGKTPDQTEMIDAINNALYDIGGSTSVDTTLVAVDDQLEYSLASGTYNVVKIEIENDVVDNYDYHTIEYWHEADGKIYLPEALKYTAGNTIRIYYNPVPTVVSEETDTISDDIPLPLLTATAAYHYQWNKYQDRANLTVKDNNILQKAEKDMQLAQIRWRVHRLSRENDRNYDQSLDKTKKD